MNKTYRSGLGALVVALSAPFLLSACGGSDGKSCGTFTPCGGSVTGNWKIASTCFSGAAPDDECPGGTVDASGVSATGTMAFNADMTYSSQTTLSGTMKMYMPSSCLMQDGITLTCEQLQLFLQLAATQPDSPFSGGTCASANNGCNCSLTFKPTSGSEQGTYATSGNVLTMTSATGSAEANDYCVSGSKLQFKPMSMGGMMGMDFTGVITLTKQ